MKEEYETKKKERKKDVCIFLTIKKQTLATFHPSNAFMREKTNRNSPLNWSVNVAERRKEREKMEG